MSFGNIVYEDQYLQRYINQYVSGRSIELQFKLENAAKQNQAMLYAQKLKRDQILRRVREHNERYAMQMEDKPSIAFKKKTAKEKSHKKKMLNRL